MTTKSIIDNIKLEQQVEYVEELYEKVRLGDETAFNETVSLHRVAFDNLLNSLKKRFPTISDTDIRQCCYIGLYEAILCGRKGYNYTTSFSNRATHKAELLYREEKDYNERFDTFAVIESERYEIDKVTDKNERNEFLYRIIATRLSPIHQYTIIHFYGLDGGHEWKNQDIADKIGYTKQNVSRMINRIEYKLLNLIRFDYANRAILSPDFHIKDLWDNTKHQDTDKYYKKYKHLARKAYHTIMTENSYLSTGMMKKSMKSTKNKPVNRQKE